MNAAVPPPATSLGPEHLAPCLELDRASLGGLWSPSQWERQLGAPAHPGVGLFGEGALLAMACGWLILDELHITLVAVAPPWRRRGFGRRALECLLERGRCGGAARATLEVAAANGPARALYASVGFHTAGVRRGYYRNGDDALIQWAELFTQSRCG